MLKTDLKIIVLVFFLFVVDQLAFAQEHSEKELPELNDPKVRNRLSWDLVKPDIGVGFGSVNTHYEKSSAPSIADLQPTWEKRAWKGERIHTQLVLYSKKSLSNVELQVSDLKRKDSNKKIGNNNIKANFVRYVMTSDLGDLKQGCDIRIKLDSSLRADIIDDAAVYNIADSTTRPIWLSINISRDTEAGVYRGALIVKATGYKQRLPFEITVLEHILPDSKKWSFHLDLWQNPYSDARVAGVKLWSKAHFDVMKPVYERLASAGQKVITSTLIHDPWKSQTYDVYGGMIKWIKQKDGNWRYDFDVFDRWVEFMISLGIDKQINAYGMIPWTLEFTYYDEATRENKLFKASPESIEYAAYWRRMLSAFATHLKHKGWFEKTMIAMDERPSAHMQAAIKVIKEADPNFKISMAGNYHEELQAYLTDYCISSTNRMPFDVVKERREKGFISTFYTSCTEIFPNTFTSSEYADLAWLPWHALYNNFDGYLRWDYNNWNANPTQDSRYSVFPAGDCFFVYPGNRTSIRFERLREGIQDFEKVQVLRHQFEKNGDQDKLRRLQQIIGTFKIESLDQTNAHYFVDKAQQELNTF
ncbi:DUF4091 domain-containing protein [Sphingobacterium faecale]|uniref:DUF4091 domain-containing protein n=1 Tax=Sphingobacterium faecale TaxID=2803775 RepID=A0ABS1R421_9SPHI|nr:DUF4091 domain-containing protein [Sphingobacterium faecale]MBL1409030.1 DUF4091 domain-containing protein [Sphingobacterium faecale]